MEALIDIMQAITEIDTTEELYVIMEIIDGKNILSAVYVKPGEPNYSYEEIGEL